VDGLFDLLQAHFEGAAHAFGRRDNFGIICLTAILRALAFLFRSAAPDWPTTSEQP
jgi:hypothetical protein